MRHDPIKDSQYTWRTDANGNRVQFKSCPRCSAAAGQAIYHPLEDFGNRIMRGKVTVQSYCTKCRGEVAREASRVGA